MGLACINEDIVLQIFLNGSDTLRSIRRGPRLTEKNCPEQLRVSIQQTQLKAYEQTWTAISISEAADGASRCWNGNGLRHKWAIFSKCRKRNMCHIRSFVSKIHRVEHHKRYKEHATNYVYLGGVTMEWI